MLNIHSIESLGTYDGPGIRLVVFLQGCAFKCLYCANPDTINFSGGKQTPHKEIIRLAENQRPFFGTKGGVTLSGGEPLWQAKELIPLFRELKKIGINTCIDTNGNVFNDDVKELLGFTDLVLLDIKHINREWHKKITGKDNGTTLKFATYLKDQNISTWLRYVLVPEYSNQDEFLHELGFCFEDYGNIKKLEIQPYHKLGVHKYEHLGWEYKLKNVPENSIEQLNQAQNILSKYFNKVIIN